MAEQKWIPVTERLPDKPQATWVKAEGHRDGPFIGLYDPRIKCWAIVPPFTFLTTGFITHWMPITVNAVEVVHGRWIWKDGKCFCSAYKEQGEPKFVDQDGYVEEYPYCPNCGALLLKAGFRTVIAEEKPPLMGKEELEYILKGPAKTGPATLLHNKDCPYGYQCRAMDCMECAELYGKDVDHVDGLASDESDKVNTAGEPV